MEQKYDYEKMFALTNDLLAIIKEAKFDTETMSLIIEKINESKSYFTGQAAEAFRKVAKEAILNVSNDNIESVLKLVSVAQMPRNNAEAMQVTDKFIENKIKVIFKK